MLPFHSAFFSAGPPLHQRSLAGIICCLATVVGVGAGWPAWLCASTARNWWAPSSKPAILRVFYSGTDTGSEQFQVRTPKGCSSVEKR
jgi:hypothetical protein